MKPLGRIAEGWRAFRASGRLHNMVVFLIFLGISTVFWFVLAMNDNMQRTLTVRIHIAGVPDSVKFITDPPADMHVTVRDKGTTLLRAGGFRQPTLTFSFKEYADNGALVCSRTDVMAALKATFGQNAMILSTSLDSLRLSYATGRGRRVPVVCNVTASPAAGMVIAGSPSASPSRVVAYGPKEVLDTLTRVFTNPVTARNLQEPTDLKVHLAGVPGVRLEPSEVTVTIPAEPLVAKEFSVPLTTVNVPSGVELLVFPSKVLVEVFVPMSRFSESDVPVEAVVDYRDVPLPTDKLPVTVRMKGEGVFQPRLRTDSVEYAVVK